MVSKTAILTIGLIGAGAYILNNSSSSSQIFGNGGGGVMYSPVGTGEGASSSKKEDAVVYDLPDVNIYEVADVPVEAKKESSSSGGGGSSYVSFADSSLSKDSGFLPVSTPFGTSYVDTGSSKKTSSPVSNKEAVKTTIIGRLFKSIPSFF